MRALLVAALLLAGCSQPASKPPITTPPGCESPPIGEPMTKEQCECRGARVNLSIGGGDQPHCAESELEIGTVRLGIEGGWCCQPGAASPTPPMTND